MLHTCRSWRGWRRWLEASLLTLCSLIAALPGEELLCCVCRSETVVPGNQLVSCEKCRHGERAGYLNGRICPGSSGLPLAFLAWVLCLLSWPVFTLSLHLSVERES